VSSFDETLLDGLDSPAVIDVADPAGLLLVCASAAAAARRGRTAVEESDLGALVADGRPRSLLVAGAGVHADAATLLIGLAGPGSPAPVVRLDAAAGQLPGWAGVADVLAVVSSTGEEPALVALAEQGARRGCRLLAVTPAGTPLADVVDGGHGSVVALPAAAGALDGPWLGFVPLVLAAERLRLLSLPDSDVEVAAERLEQVAHACRPASESFLNPAKELAVGLADHVPVLWAEGPLALAAAGRAASQLGVVAGVPAVVSSVAEAVAGGVALLDGPLGAATGTRDRDPLPDVAEEELDEFFADREADVPLRLRAVLVIDAEARSDAAPEVRVTPATALADAARARRLDVTELAAEPGPPLARLAGLVATLDHAVTYLALGLGEQPGAGVAVTELAGRLR
jgi:glucose/mannose-6-phosphate isomerase